LAASEAKQSAWEARVFELKIRGLTDASVSNQMRGEGYEKVSVGSIRRYIADERGKGNWDLIEEL
jgi:hypothetical protein